MDGDSISIDPESRDDPLGKEKIPIPEKKEMAYTAAQPRMMPQMERLEGSAGFLKVVGVIIVVLMLIIAAYIVLAKQPGIFIPDIFDNDTHIPRSEWAFSMTQASQLAEQDLTGAGVSICVVDSGIDASHPDLANANITLWKDFINGNSEPYDDAGHGTSMAGIIAANGKIVGIAPEVKLMIVKAIPAGGQGTDSQVAEAVDFCIDPNGDGSSADGADIISMSLGGGEHRMFGSAVGDAANRAIDRGIFVVASAGNDGEHDDGDVESPASEERVIAVGAVDENGYVASFSSKGDNDGRSPMLQPPFDTDRQDPDKKPEIAAPGVDVMTLRPDGKYAMVTGTSPAAAFVSGILALILQEHPTYRKAGNDIKIDDLKNALMSTAKKPDGQTATHDDKYGYGLIQAAALGSST